MLISAPSSCAHLCLPRDKQQLTVKTHRSSLFVTCLVLLACMAAKPARGQVSDEFNGTSLNTGLWQVETPAGGSATVSNGELAITVPGGSNHDAYVPALDAVQVVQPISNVNFDVAVKIDSTLTAATQYYGQGIMVEGDANDYIRYGVGAGGSISLGANTIISGNESTPFQTQPFTRYAVPTYLRLTRLGSTYTGFWSTDGVNWTEAGSFSDSLVVTGLAPYAWNYNSTPSNSPALNAKFDWFHNLADTTQTAATPTFSPASGTTFSSTLSVSISDATQGATIYYTTDGSAPTTSSQVYSGPFTISASTTVNAIATASGFTQSAQGSASYTFVPVTGGGPVSDEFNGTSLNTGLWQVEASAGGSATVSNGELVITVPKGSNHDAHIPGLDAVQVVQPISNENFDVAVKIDSTLTAANQYYGQGLLVEGDASDYIRYGVGAGGSISLGANTIISGNESTPFQTQPFTGYAVPTYLRLTRVGSTYTGYWSTDGVNWTQAGSFSDSSLVVTGLAPYAWNYNSTPSNAPALTAKFDWFHNLTTTTQTAATPTFSPASGTTFSSTLSVSISDATPGATIYYTTNGSTPTTSSQVYSGPFTISASTTVNAIATASGFTQSAQGSASYTLTTVAHPAATPTFSPASGTTFSSTLSVSISDATPGATIYYTTDGSTPTTSSQVYSGPFTISASTKVNAIATASGFTQSAQGSASYTFVPVVGGSIVSDNFDESSLNTSLWTIENPLGDGTVTMNGSGVILNVPQSTVHDPWTNGDTTLRVMQAVGNSDLSADVRFQSVGEIANQEEGILVEQDSADFLRFDVIYGVGGPFLFAAGINGSNATIFINSPISLPKGPVALRLARSSNVWTAGWSTDGTNFTTISSFTFDLNVAKMGPFAGNANSTAANTPAFTATVDYFFNTANPISNRDGPLPWGYVTVDANPSGTLVEKTFADIEGIGHMEPVIGLEATSQSGNTSNGGIFWYQYPASGNVNDTWNKYTIVASGDAYEDMLAYDVNGDGAVDIVASYGPTGSGNYSIVWFENPRGSGGDPTQPWVMHVIGPGSGENNLELADIDGDGKMDIVTPSSIFFQNGPTSWTQVQYSTSGRGVALLDIGSGNGSINLVGTQPASPYNMAWWENPRETGGDARTGRWILHIIGPGYPCNANNCGDGGEVAAFAATDVNGDGSIDVISAQSEGPGGGIAPPPGGLIWWQAPSDRRNGTWTKHTIDPNMIDVHKIALGDMDRNGTLDIVVGEQDQAPLDRVAVYYNDGTGNLTPQIIANAKAHNICVGNVIGNNGELDILNSGHGYFNDSHPLQIFFTPY